MEKHGAHERLSETLYLLKALCTNLPCKNFRTVVSARLQPSNSEIHPKWEQDYNKCCETSSLT